MSKKILVVDDDKELCEELSEILNEEGFDAHYALTQIKAKELLEANTFDVLLLDFKMPKVNGIEFLEEIRDKLNNTKVFIISGSLLINKLLAESGLSSLVADVLNKPFSVEALLEKIR